MDTNERSTGGARRGPTSTRTRWGRRNPGGGFLLALLLVPLLLALVAGFVGRGGIEDDLTSRAQAALNAQGINDADISFDGRDGTLKLPDGADADAAEDVVLGVDGVRVVDVSGGGKAAPDDGEEAPAGAGPYALTVAKGKIVVEAVVGSEDEKTALIQAVTATAGKKQVVDQVTVTEGAAAPSATDLAAVAGGLSASPGTKAVWDGTTLTLTGEVPSKAVKSEVAAAAQPLVTAAGADATLVNQLVVKAKPSPDAACADLNDAMAGIQKSNELQFGESSPELTGTSQDAIDDIAALLKKCPDTSVEVGGHTDNQGDPATSQPLSEDRARTVRDALVQAGVEASRITAVGYGESKPIASNDTADGRATNRRVDITVK